MFAARAAFLAKPSESLTSSLLHLDSDLTDSAGATWTASGATISTSVKKFGAGSLNIASGQYIQQTGDATKFAFGTGDFTIEMQVYATALSGVRVFYDSRPSGTQTTQPTLYFNGQTVNYYANSTNVIVGSSTLATSTWYHIALSRKTGTTRMFVNGTQEGSSASDSTSYTNTTNRPLIGIDSFSGGNAFVGYIDEVRVTRSGLYSANFTAPTAAFS